MGRGGKPMNIAKSAVIAASIVFELLVIVPASTLADCTVNLSYDQGILDLGIAPDDGSFQPQQTVNFTNNSPCAVPMSASIWDGGDAFEFAIVDDTCGTSLPASPASCYYTIQFTADGMGEFDDDLLVTTTPGDQDSPYDVSLYANGSQENPVVIPNSIFYSTLTSDQTQTQYITLTHYGSGSTPLTATIGGANPGDFTISGRAINGAAACGATLSGSSSCAYAVTFQPVAGGARTAEAVITETSDQYSPRTIPLVGNGTGTFSPPEGPGNTTASISRTAIDFGTQQQWADVAQSVTITNTGSNPLAVSSLTFSDPIDFRVAGNTCPAAGLNRNGACTITIAFAPQSTGTIAGTLAIAENSDTNPQIVNLTGISTAPGTTTVHVTPASVDFGAVAVGGSALAHVHVENYSYSYSLHITGTGVSDGADFGIIDNQCSPSIGIAAGATCTITLDFAPQPQQSYPATVNGTLTITDNAGGGSQTVSLTGTAASPASLPVSLSATALNFGAQSVGTAAQQSFIITNNQGVAMNIYNLTLAGALGFGIASSTCGLSLNGSGTLAANASCTVVASFTPQALGAANAALAFIDDASTSPQVVNLSGSGTAPPTNATDTVSPNPLNFAATVPGYSVIQNLTINNTGGIPLYISSLAMSDSSDFGVASNGCPAMPASLAPNGACTIAVDYSPQSSGNAAGTLTIANNTAAGAETVNLSGSTTTCPIGQNSGPDSPSADPDTFLAEEDTQLTVTSVVSPDPNLIKSSITLLRVDSAGNEIAELGRMYDDGTHGDLQPNDGKYTGQFTFNEPAPPNYPQTLTVPIYLAVRASYSSAPGCRQSNTNVHEIDVTGPRPSATELQREDNAVQAGGAFFYGEIDQGTDPVQARQDLVNFLLANYGPNGAVDPGVVVSASVGPDGTTVGLTFASGRGAGYMTGDPSYLGGGNPPKKSKSGRGESKTKHAGAPGTHAKESKTGAKRPAIAPGSAPTQGAAAPTPGGKP